MSTDLMINAADVVFAIRGAYRSGAECRCETVPKLGCDELLEHLIGQRLLPDTAVYAANSIRFEDIPSDELVGLRAWDLRHIGINYLVEATVCTREDLMRYPNWGPAKIAVLERILARRGMTLRGVDPGIIDRVKQEDEESQRMAQVPDSDRPETFDAALEGLIKIGRALLDDGQLLLNAAAKIAVRAQDGRKGRKYYITILTKYANNAERGSAHQVRWLLEALAGPEEAERAREPKRRKRIERHTDERPSNVVRLVAAE